MRRVRQRGDCGRCDRVDVGVHVPAHGDGTAYWTYWHRNRATGAWCRSELDLEVVRFGDDQTAG